MERIVIVAVSQNGIIGVNNGIPWKHKADMKRFKELTTGNTIIMGRKTYQSIGRPLPNRRNIVISRTVVDQEGIETFSSLEAALATVDGKVYFIGGQRIYEEAMGLATKLDVTIVPETIAHSDEDVQVACPWINPLMFKVESIVRDDINNLVHVNYTRI